MDTNGLHWIAVGDIIELARLIRSVPGNRQSRVGVAPQRSTIPES